MCVTGFCGENAQVAPQLQGGMRALKLGILEINLEAQAFGVTVRF